MADMEEDKEVSRRYRELGGEEPPPALDARIRAEARSALETRAAPLVPPTGRRHWYFPVAAAAVIILAVAVTSQIEREQPQEAAVPEKQNAEEAKREQPAQADALAKRPEPQPFAEQQKKKVAPRAPTSERPSREDFNRDSRSRQERPAFPAPAAPAASPPPAPPSAARAEAQRETTANENAAARGVAPARKSADIASGALSASPQSFATPEAWLAHIEMLRRAGNDDEADRQLEAFRKRYPDYRIAPETLKKVEKRK